MFESKEKFIEEYKERVAQTFGTSLERTHPADRFLVLSDMVRDHASVNWRDTNAKARSKQGKTVFYFSMEFLLGRSLKNNLKNLGIFDMVREGFEDLGLSLDDVLETESDAGLGNGGLGRLAACFMDSAATLNYPVHGDCLRYQYGMFRQKINEAGEQIEIPDMWLRIGNPWEIRKVKNTVEVRYWGHVNVTGDVNGDLHFDHVGATVVRAVPYDMPMIGANTKMTNTLRLWSAEPADEVPAGMDYRDYLSKVSEICRNVYPDDSTEDGRFLRLKQQYFLVAAGIQTIVREHLENNPSLDNLADKVCIQLNDTHPVLAIPELMRVLMDEHGYKWQAAFEITRNVMAYTNHTIMVEALEAWPVSYVQRLLPRIYMIIEELDRQAVTYIQNRFPGDYGLVQRTRIIDNNAIQMARIAIHDGFSVNGVAGIHTEILKNDLFKDFYYLYPWKFSNKTNGITPRRWCLYANPELEALLDRTIGKEYRNNFDKIADLEAYVDDPQLQHDFLVVKHQRKEIMADYIRKTTGIEVKSEAIFDTQAKRLHAYKRQLLNILHVIYLYQRAKDDPNFRIYPRVFLFAAKAAPAYVFAKKVIKLINNVAQVINNDPMVNGMMKVVFLPDYRVSMSELLVTATDVSEQISMAGKEASGTGNMKFMMNGAITLGTLDGANVEIDQLVGRENDVIFGKTVDQIASFRDGYRAWDFCMGDRRLMKAVNSLVDGTWSRKVDDFRLIYDELLGRNDEYLVLADFDAYVSAQEEIERRYRERNNWARSCLINIARSAYFSSDRTISQYAKDIWHVEPLEF
ncbi:MAG: glycogen/starch/alpha-glucan phosphorylase [Solobacterium sp.]|nr:glycogen/starch/alpha-glucan phosphorylase [Solobacterium sp.]